MPDPCQGVLTRASLACWGSQHAMPWAAHNAPGPAVDNCGHMVTTACIVQYST
jgi:hypothetical protein